VAFVINKNAVNIDILTCVHVMLGVVGEKTSVLALSNAIRLYVFNAYLSSLDKIPFVNHRRAKIGSVLVECLD